MTKILNKRSNIKDKLPTESQLEFGEIAVNYNEEAPFLAIKDSDNQIIKVKIGEYGEETPESIAEKYESNSNTNKFTDENVAKLDSIETGAQVNPEVLPNPYPLIINGISYDGSEEVIAPSPSIAWEDVESKPVFAPVATSNNYQDLNNKPVIPSTVGLATEQYVNTAINTVKAQSQAYADGVLTEAEKYTLEVTEAAEQASKNYSDVIKQSLIDNEISEAEANAIANAAVEAARLDAIALDAAKDFTLTETEVIQSDLDNYKKIVSQDFATVNASIINIETQMDDTVVNWSGSAVPTLNNYPAYNWITEEMLDFHTGDLYTQIVDNVIVGMFEFKLDNTVYQWDKLSNKETAETTALVEQIYDIVGTKGAIYYSTVPPTPPYVKNDIWLNLNDNSLSIALVSRETGSSTTSDWRLIINAEARLNDMTNDNIISAEEKPQYKNIRDQIVSEFVQYENDANHYDVNMTELSTAYTAVIAIFRDVLKIDLPETTILTESQKNTYNTTISNYYAKRTEFANLIAQKISDISLGNLIIGTVNLFNNSNSPDIMTAGTGATLIKSEASLEEEFGIVEANKVLSSGGTTAEKALIITVRNTDTTIGLTISQSIYIKNNSTETISLYSNYGEVTTVEGGTYKLVKIENIQRQLNSAHVMFKIFTTSIDTPLDIIWANLMVVEGNKIGDYTLSPHDQKELEDAALSQISERIPFERNSDGSLKQVEGFTITDKEGNPVHTLGYNGQASFSKGNVNFDAEKAIINGELYADSANISNVVFGNGTTSFLSSENGGFIIGQDLNLDSIYTGASSLVTGWRVGLEAVCSLTSGESNYTKEKGGNILGVEIPYYLRGKYANINAKFRQWLVEGESEAKSLVIPKLIFLSIETGEVLHEHISEAVIIQTGSIVDINLGLGIERIPQEECRVTFALQPLWNEGVTQISGTLTDPHEGAWLDCTIERPKYVSVCGNRGLETGEELEAHTDSPTQFAVSENVITKNFTDNDGSTWWYRKYSSGWLEQGGHYGTGVGHTSETIAFPITFLKIESATASTNHGRVLNGTWWAAMINQEPLHNEYLNVIRRRGSPTETVADTAAFSWEAKGWWKIPNT